MNSNNISLHCAVITDLHYARTPNVQIPSRRGELALQLLREAFDFYETRNPDLVLIAGDCLNDPHDPEAAHALIRQKLNEHTDAINEVRKENEEQNIKLDRIDQQLKDVKKDTAGIVEAVGFSKTLRKILIWVASIVGSLYTIWEAYKFFWGK